MTKLLVIAGPYKFEARLDTYLAPYTCAAFEKIVPYDSQLVHVRWNGEGVWIALGA